MATQPSRFMSALANFAARRAVWMVAGWIAATALINLLVPQMETVVAKDSTPILPVTAQSSMVLHEMDTAFGNGRSESFLFVVTERDSGLTAADRDYMRGLVHRLRADQAVTFVQDIAARPDLLTALTSKDGEAAYLQVGIDGATGAPRATAQIERIREIVTTERPAGLDVAVSGPAATIADMSTEVERSILWITGVTVILIALLLLAIYRSLSVTFLVLSVIGLALALARGVTALMGLHVFPISTFTGSFMTAVVLGASTDYAVFLVSRYQELRRDGVEPALAVRQAAAKVSAVIIGSGLTVIVANAAMLTTEVGIFRTTGPAIATSVAATLLLSLTLTPAALALAARFGLLEPRTHSGTDRWAGIAATVVQKPVRMLALGLLPLLVLASFYPLLQLSFDERGAQPDDTDSNHGYDLLEAHFPLNEVLPDYVMIHSDRDLRDARGLAALEQTARAIAGVPDVVSVRGITRPLGTPLEEASLTYRADAVGSRLSSAKDELVAKGDGVDRLTDGSARLDEGASRLSDGADRVSDGADLAADGSGRLLDGVEELQAGLDRLTAGAADATVGSTRIRAGADELADRLAAGQSRAQYAVDGLGQALRGLNMSVACSLDPICRQARDGVRQVYEGERDEMLPGLAAAVDGARRLADGSAELHTGLQQIQDGLDRARTGAGRIADGQRTMTSKLGELAAGAGQVSDGADEVAGGTSQVAGGTAEMKASLDRLERGLGAAASALKEPGAAVKDPALGGFYLPPAALRDPRLATAAGLFLSADGHTARLVVLGATDSFKPSAEKRAAGVQQAARTAFAQADLGPARVDVTGIAAINGDLDRISTGEFRTVALIALLAVFLILVFLLRSLVAPVFLLAAVCLSYAAAMGLSVLTWQVLLDKPLDWSVPTIAFILLVAVGADYNLLVMKRMLEDSPDGSRDGIARAVAATGRVITAAGLIFAASVFAMMAGSVTTLAQVGFTIGMGLLLDTFVVRTLVIPSVAALLGPRLWWPRRGPVEGLAP